MKVNSFVDAIDQWPITLITHGKLLVDQLAIDKVSFLPKILGYHGDIEELSLPMAVLILHNVFFEGFNSNFDVDSSLCIAKDMFLDLLTHGEVLELIGIVFKWSACVIILGALSLCLFFILIELFICIIIHTLI